MITSINKFRITEASETEWELQNSSSSMKLEYPPKPDSLTARFTQYVFANPGCTKKEFYDFIGKKLEPGNNAHFFAAINQAGIVELVGSKYYIGPNYGAWTQGKLKVKKTQPKYPWHKN